MNSHGTIFSGVITAGSVSVVGRFCSIIFNLWLLKLFSPEQLGIVFGVQASVLILTGFLDLGVTQGFRLLGSRQPASKERYLSIAFQIQIASTLSCFLALLLYLHIIGLLRVDAVLLLIAFLLINLPTIFGVDFVIVGRYWSMALFEGSAVAVMGVAVLLSTMCEGDLLVFSLSYCFGAFVRCLIAVWPTGWRLLNQRDYRLFKTLFNASLPFFVSLSVSKIGLHIGSVVALTYFGAYQLGIVGVPQKLYVIGLVGVTTILSVLMPRLHSNHASNDQERQVRLVGGFFPIILLAHVSICYLFWIVPAHAVNLAPFSQYSESLSYFPVYTFALLLKGLSLPAGSFLEVEGAQWYRVRVQAMSSLMITLVTLAMIPVFGLLSIPLGLVAGDLVSLSLLWFKLRDSAYIRICASVALKVFVLTGLCWVVSKFGAHFVLESMIFIVLLLSSSVFLKVIDIKELGAQR